MRRTAVAALVLSLSFVGVGDLVAQRSGFIIGFGVGAGVSTFEDGESSVAFATDFKIGAQLAPSWQVYYLGRSSWFTIEGSNLIVAGLSALGATYVIPSARVQLSAGAGLFHWVFFDFEAQSATSVGFTGGIGYEFVDLWLLDFAVTYGSPYDASTWHFRAGISVLSH